MIVKQIICDCCNAEMKSYVYFVSATAMQIEVSTFEPADAVDIQHVCGAECATKLVSRWATGESAPGKKRETNGNHDTARSGK
jgi:hypothetical protein